MIERFITTTIGLPADEAAEEARTLEHHLSDRSWRASARLVGEAPGEWCRRVGTLPGRSDRGLAPADERDAARAPARRTIVRRCERQPSDAPAAATISPPRHGRGAASSRPRSARRRPAARARDRRRARRRCTRRPPRGCAASRRARGRRARAPRRPAAAAGRLLTTRACTPEAAHISRRCPSSPKPVTSVTACGPSSRSAAAPARLSVVIEATAAASTSSSTASLRSAFATMPVPSAFVSTSTSPDLRAGVAPDAVGVHEPRHGEPVERLGGRDRVPAEDRRSGRERDVGAAAQDLAHVAIGQVAGKAADREREERLAAHREDVRDRIRRCDAPVVVGVVDDRREHVDRLHDRLIVVQPHDGSVVERVVADEDAVVARGRARHALEQLGEALGGHLARAAAPGGTLRQPRQLDLHLARSYTRPIEPPRPDPLPSQRDDDRAHGSARRGRDAARGGRGAARARPPAVGRAARGARGAVRDRRAAERRGDRRGHRQAARPPTSPRSTATSRRSSGSGWCSTSTSGTAPVATCAPDGSGSTSCASAAARSAPSPPEQLDGVRQAVREATGFDARFSHFPIVGLCADCTVPRGLRATARPGSDPDRAAKRSDQAVAGAGAVVGRGRRRRAVVRARSVPFGPPGMPS